MDYAFLVDTYETESLKIVSVWSQFRDEDLEVRPRSGDPRGRSVHEQMVHQCVSEDAWFRNMLGIDMAFIRRYAADSATRLKVLREQREAWWQEERTFFDVRRSRAWIMTRRLTHTAHHRGQLTAMLRMLGRDVYSTYGPTADTGGLMQDHAPTIYPYPSLTALVEGEANGGAKATLPQPSGKPVTERPGRKPG